MAKILKSGTHAGMCVYPQYEYEVELDNIDFSYIKENNLEEYIIDKDDLKDQIVFNWEFRATESKFSYEVFFYLVDIFGIEKEMNIGGIAFLKDSTGEINAAVIHKTVDAHIGHFISKVSV